MDDNKLIGIDENIEDCIILDNKDEAALENARKRFTINAKTTKIPDNFLG